MLELNANYRTDSIDMLTNILVTRNINNNFMKLKSHSYPKFNPNIFITIPNFNYEISGLKCDHGFTASKAADAAITVSSSPYFPIMCNPTGRPSDVIPAGMLAAGFPAEFIGYVKGRQPQEPSSSEPSIVSGGFPHS